jgi:hypothetical protein
MAKGISIHVGVNRPAFFPQSKLTHCEDDANAMLKISKAAGFAPTLFLGSNATFDNVVNAIKQAAVDLNEAGSTFLFTFSGHGTQDPTFDLTTEPDGFDETIALSDHLLFDNFWRSDLWPRFQPGVRAIAVADCCHGGGVFLILHLLSEALSATEAQIPGLAPHLEVASLLLSRTSRILSVRKSSLGSRMFFAQPFSEPRIGQLIVRRIPEGARQKELDDFNEFYEKQRVPPTKSITVERLFLAACNENEDAVEGQQHGAFTQVLLDVWDHGGFTGNYREFMSQIQSKFTATIQHPVIRPDPLPAFSSETPFTI